MEPNEPQILITLVDELEHLPHVMSIVEQYSWYALDLEGVALGRNGHITMLQLAIDSKHVYCVWLPEADSGRWASVQAMLRCTLRR